MEIILIHKTLITSHITVITNKMKTLKISLSHKMTNIMTVNIIRAKTNNIQTVNNIKVQTNKVITVNITRVRIKTTLQMDLRGVLTEPQINQFTKNHINQLLRDLSNNKIHLVI